MAMRLHTKDQAPKEGGKEASKTPMMAVCTADGCWVHKRTAPHSGSQQWRATCAS